MQPSLKSIPLPNGDVLEYYMTPLTLAERAKAQKQAKAGDNADFALQLLVAKAKDQNGTPIFTIADIPELRQALPAELVESLMKPLIEEDEEEPLDIKSPDQGATKRRAASA